MTIAQNVRARRREAKLSQLKMAEQSGVSLGSLKRFEQTGEISLLSLIKLAMILDREEEMDSLFSRKTISSIEEIIRGNI